MTADDVRQPGEVEERGAALEVDQHQVQLQRRVGRRQPQHQGAQQLALPGPGGPDAEPVRSAAALRRLLEIERHRSARVVDPDRHPQPVGVGPGPAVAQRGDPGRTGPQLEQRGQPGIGRRIARRPPPRHRPGGSGPAAGRRPRPRPRDARRAGRSVPAARRRCDPADSRSGPTTSRTTRRTGSPTGRGPDPQHGDPGAPAHGSRPVGSPRRRRSAGAARPRRARLGARRARRPTTGEPRRRDAATMRTGPAVDRSSGCAVCGSQLTQSHSGASAAGR